MKIAFNPSTVAALTTPPNNKDITFDLRGHSIFARGVEFKGTDTNTWRDIKINNVSIGSYTLDLRNGSNTTLTNTNGVVTINSTWRPVVDNLTSDSTTSSLSANQGRVLKALIDGKFNSDHNHDGRYVRYYAVTTLDCNNLAAGLTAARISATNAAHTNPSAYLYISDVGTPFQIQIPDSSIPYIYKRYYGSGKWSGWFKLNAGYADSAGSVAWANVTGKPSSYTPSAHTHDDRYYTKAESNAKYITDITTPVNKLTFTRNGSNIIRGIAVSVVYSQGYLTNIPNKDATTKASSGLLIYNSYNQTIGTNYYSSVLSINTGGTIQIAGNWGDDWTRNLYWRSQSDRNVADYPWKSWRTILDSENTYVNNNKGYINGLEITYAASAGNADTLDGYPANGSNDRPYGHIPTIESDGVMEVGRYIDFHNDNNGKHDFSTRLQSTGNYGNEVNLPSASGTLALINDVNNYYWANVKISTSSSTTTSPTVSNLTATSSIRMSNISLEHTDEINNSANDSIHLNFRNSGNVSLCVGGGKVGIGTMFPSQELYVRGYTHTNGFGIGIQYLSEAVFLPTINPGDGYLYRCLEIGRPTKVSCIIADKVPLSGLRGILLRFMQGFDGQIVLLKDLENYGNGNGCFWVMPSGCKIITAENSNTLIDQNQIDNMFDDGRSRFFIYSSKYSAWIEFN